MFDLRLIRCMDGADLRYDRKIHCVPAKSFALNVKNRKYSFHQAYNFIMSIIALRDPNINAITPITHIITFFKATQFPGPKPTSQ